MSESDEFDDMFREGNPDLFSADDSPAEVVVTDPKHLTVAELALLLKEAGFAINAILDDLGNAGILVNSIDVTQIRSYSGSVKYTIKLDASLDTRPHQLNFESSDLL